MSTAASVVYLLGLSFLLGALRSIQVCGFACGAVVLFAQSRAKKKRRFFLQFFFSRPLLLSVVGFIIGLTSSLILQAALGPLIILSSCLFIGISLILLLNGWKGLSRALDAFFKLPPRWTVKPSRISLFLKKAFIEKPYVLGFLLSIGCVTEVSLLEGSIITATSLMLAPLGYLAPITALSFFMFGMGMNTAILPLGTVKDSHIRWWHERKILPLLPPVVSIVLGAYLFYQYTFLLVTFI